MFIKGTKILIVAMGLFLGTGSLAFSQNLDTEPRLIDVRSYEVEVGITPDKAFLRGRVAVEFVVLRRTLALYFDFNQQLILLGVKAEDEHQYSLRSGGVRSDQIRVQRNEFFEEGETCKLYMDFEGMLDAEQYAFLDVAEDQSAVITPDGAVLLNSGFWFPSHQFPIDAALVTLKATVPLGFTAVAPGRLESIDTLGITEMFTWKSDELLTGAPLLVSRFYRQEAEDFPLPTTYYVLPDFQEDLTPISEMLSGILNYYEGLYGSIPADQLNLVQVGNQVLDSPVERGIILLEDDLLLDKRKPLWEYARRIAQLWWGTSVRFSRGSDAWLREGFSGYAALQYMNSSDPELFRKELNRQAINALKYQETAPIQAGISLETGSETYRSVVASKGAWVLYMLSQLVGPDVLNDIMVEFYSLYSGKSATIPDFVKLLEEKTGQEFSWFFVQWIESVGVPEIEIDYTVFKLKSGGYKIRGQVMQDMDLFRMPMDLLIETEGENEEKEMTVNGPRTSFTFETTELPTRIEVDPQGKILMDSDRMRLNVFIALGDEYREAGEFVSAVEEYQSAADMNQRNSLANFRLGQVFFEQASYSNSANSVREALNGDLQPEWVAAWSHIYLGKIYDILGQRQRARAEYRKAINSKIDYDNAQAEANKYFEKAYTRRDSVMSDN
jgi:Peptidase family M1 domain